MSVVVRNAIVFSLSVIKPANKKGVTKKLELLLQHLTTSKNIPLIVGDEGYHQYSEFLARDLELLDDGKPDCLD